jgi:hypothetical protein
MRRTIALGSSDLELCMDKWEILKVNNRTKLKREWIPKGGFLLFTRGSGRKRTFSAIFDAIVSGAMDAGTHFDALEKHIVLGKLKCPKLCLLVCSEQLISEWSTEFQGEKIIIKCEEDFSQLTYFRALEGALILITNEMLLKSTSRAQHQINLVNKISAKDNGRGSKLYLDDPLCQRFHICNLGERMPGAVCPLDFLTPRCAVIDDVNLSEPKEFYNQFQCLERISADWTWITSGFNGVPPTHVPMEWMLSSRGVLGLPKDDSKIYDKDGLGEQLLPSIYSQVHHSKEGIIATLTMPRSLMRKVTLIPTKTPVSTKEIDFISSIKFILSQVDPLNAETLSNEEILLGCNVKKIQGLSIDVAVQRTEPMSMVEANDSLLNHFCYQAQGTLAQRLQNSSLSSSLGFAKEALQSLLSKECCVCYSEPGSVLSLCGHGYCEDCSKMLRKEEEKSGITTCSACRASLCAYDWLRVKENSPISTFYSKGEALLKTLDTLFSKKRQRKRVSKVFVIVPDAVKQTIKNYLSLRSFSCRRFGETSEEEKPRNVVIYTFDEILFEERFDEGLDAIVLGSPCTLLDPSTFYSKLIRCSTHRSFPLPVYLLYADGLESSDTARRYLNASTSKSPVRG